MRIQGRWKINAVLLLLVCLLGVFVWLKPGKQTVVEAPLLDLRNGAVNQISLENGEHLLFERRDSGWELVEPFHARVNQVRIEQLLAIPMLSPAAEYPLPETSELPGYGLGKPFATLGIDGQKLEFGDVAPLNRRRYVRMNDRLYLLDDGFSHQLSSKSTDFVDKKLVPDQAIIQGLLIPGLRVSKAEEGGWHAMPALGQEQLQDLVMQWATARAIEVRRGAPKVLGETIEVETALGPIRFSILQKNPELVLSRSDQDLVYVMTAESSRLLLNLPRVPGAKGDHEDDSHHDDDHEHEHSDDE